MANCMTVSTHYPWTLRLIFWFQKKKYGEVLHSALVWGRSPKIFLALTHFYRAIDRKSSPVSPALRSLIIVRVSQMNGCEFCIDLNTSVLIERGVSLEKAEAIPQWKTSDLFDEREKLVLEYTEAVTMSTTKISEEMKAKMKAQFSEEEIVELTAIIAFQTMSTKFNNAFGIEAQGFCLRSQPIGK